MNLKESFFLIKSNLAHQKDHWLPPAVWLLILLLTIYLGHPMLYVYSTEKQNIAMSLFSNVALFRPTGFYCGLFYTRVGEGKSRLE